MADAVTGEDDIGGMNAKNLFGDRSEMTDVSMLKLLIKHLVVYSICIC